MPTYVGLTCKYCKQPYPVRLESGDAMHDSGVRTGPYILRCLFCIYRDVYETYGAIYSPRELSDSELQVFGSCCESIVRPRLVKAAKASAAVSVFGRGRLFR